MRNVKTKKIKMYKTMRVKSVKMHNISVIKYNKIIFSIIKELILHNAEKKYAEMYLREERTRKIRV